MPSERIRTPSGGGRPSAHNGVPTAAADLDRSISPTTGTEGQPNTEEGGFRRHDFDRNSCLRRSRKRSRKTSSASLNNSRAGQGSRGTNSQPEKAASQTGHTNSLNRSGASLNKSSTPSDVAQPSVATPLRKASEPAMTTTTATTPALKDHLAFNASTFSSNAVVITEKQQDFGVRKISEPVRRYGAKPDPVGRSFSPPGLVTNTIMFCWFFTSREADWPGRTVGRKTKKGIYGMSEILYFSVIP